MDKGDYAVEASTDVVFPHKHVVQIKVDANWAADDDGRSTTGVRVSVNNYRICHISQTQPGLPSLSSGESELRAATRGACEGIYVKKVLTEFGIEAEIEMDTDASAAYQAASKMSGGRLRHLEVADKFIRQAVKRKLLKLHKTGTLENSSDIHTKHVDKDTLARHMDETGWKQLPKTEVEQFRAAILRPINKITDLQDADLRVQQYNERVAAKASADGLALRRNQER